MRRLEETGPITRRALLAVLAFILMVEPVHAAETEESTPIALTEAIALAKEHNSALQIARLDLEQAQTELAQAQANNLVQPSPPRLIQAESQLDIAERKQTLTFRDVELEVKKAFYSALRSKDLADLAADSLDVSKRQLEVAQEKQANGSGTQGDVLSAQNRLAQAKSNLSQAEEGYALALLNLRRSIGVPFSRLVVPKAPADETDALDIALADDVSYALGHRTEILQLQAAIAAAAKQVELADNDYTPSLALKSARIALQKGRLQLADARRGIELEVRQSYLSYQTAVGNVPVLRAVVVEAEENLRVAQQLYDAQMAPLVQVMAAQVGLLKAKNEAIHGVYDRSLARARYERTVARPVKD